MKDITIIVPVHNAENTIERMLASFISNKDFIHEVILVNDRTTDKTFSKIKNFKKFFKMKVIDNKGNKGPGPARKAGILAAKSKWVTFVDADDCLTPNSLYYVQKQLSENDNTVLLHTMTIYYESGNFVAENVEHSDYSCGGNFYKREYLVKHKLLPHDTLLMSEDEYFNSIIDKYIRRYDEPEKLVKRYDYPVYEVHHDTDVELSFSFKNWADYLCKYHLLAALYEAEFFSSDEEHIQEVKEIVYNSLIFGFYLYEGLIQDKNITTSPEDMIINFVEVVDKYKKMFGMKAEDVISYYQKNEETVKSLREGARISLGFRAHFLHSFVRFMKVLFADE